MKTTRKILAMIIALVMSVSLCACAECTADRGSTSAKSDDTEIISKSDNMDVILYDTSRDGRTNCYEYSTENYDYIDDIISVDTTQTNEKGAYYYTCYLKRIITDTGNCWQNIWVHCWDTVWGGVFAKLAPVTNTARDWYIFHWNLEFWSGYNGDTTETAAASENTNSEYAICHGKKLLILSSPDVLINKSGSG